MRFCRSRSTQRPAGPTLVRLFEAELAAAVASRDSLLTRATGVIMTSGALAAVFLGFAGLVSDGQGVATPLLPLWLLGLAVAAFVIASGFAFAVLWPRPSLSVGLETLQKYTDEKLTTAPAHFLEQRLTPSLFTRIEDARTANDRLATLIAVGFGAEIIGMLLASVGVLTLIAG